MNNLKIEATKYTPEIFFDSENHCLNIVGESYPENSTQVYLPVFSWLDEYLNREDVKQITVNIELTYFNSSSSKVLMDFFEKLEDEVKKGKSITVNWIYDLENDVSLENGEEFKDYIELLTFNIVEKEDFDG